MGAISKRVKVYKLEKESWQDLGTGTWHIEAAEPEESIVVIAETSDERSPKKAKLDSDAPPEAAVLWRTLIRPVLMLSDGPEGGNYQKQQDTLIVWTETDGMDLALSFANTQGCSQVWDFIQTIRRQMFGDAFSSSSDENNSGSSDPLSDEETQQEFYARRRNAMSAGSADEPFMSARGLGMMTPSMLSRSSQPLPVPTLGNLNLVETALRLLSRTPTGRENLANWIVHTDYCSHLGGVFSDAEDLEELEALHLLCVIMQGIILLGDSLILEYILKDNIFFPIVGMLEYDPEFPDLKANYREHLADPSRFQEVVPIRNHVIVNKVHCTYRLQYLKDVILARIIDDATFSCFNSLIFFNQVDIVQYLQFNEPYLTELFAIFEEDQPPQTQADEPEIGPSLPKAPSPSPTPDPLIRQHSAILLLQQFCALAKNLQLPARNNFYKVMGQRGLLRVLERALARTSQFLHPDHQRTPEQAEQEEEMRIAAIDILMIVIDHNPNGVRAYCLSKTNSTGATTDATESRSLVLFLIELLQRERDLGIQAQMAEAIKVLVSSAGEPLAPAQGQTEQAARIKSEDPEAEKFLQYFYESCMNDLFKPITDLPDPTQLPTDAGGQLNLDSGKSALCAHLCDLLCYFVAAHSFRSKYYVLSSTICICVARLFSSTQKHLRLAALRFFKACLARKDDFYNRYLIKNDLFEPILLVAQAEFQHSKDNMLISSALDFFEFIRFQNMKAILNHLMDKHGDTMRELADKDFTMKMVLAKWEQNNEPPPPVTSETTDAQRQGPWSWKSKTLEAEEESYFNDSSDDDMADVSSDSAQPTSKKRQQSDMDAEESQQPHKRQRTTTSAPPLPTSPPPGGSPSSPKPASGMVRSPALVFQEMALKGAQGIRKRFSNPLPAPAPKTSMLVDYGEEEEDELLLPTSAPADPAHNGPLKPEAAEKALPVTPERRSSLHPPTDDSIATSLGSPFQSVALPTSPGAEEKPMLSLKSLGEKRRREEEEEDVLLTKSKSGKIKNGPASAAKPQFRLKIKNMLGGGEKK